MRKPKSPPPDPVPPTGEFLSEHLDRLTAADDQRIRVDEDHTDDRGNLIVRPVLILGKDTNDDYRPAKMDTEGRLDVVGVAPEHQADEFLNQANPVSGNKYTILDTTELVRIMGVAARVAWSGQPNPLQVHITIDGNDISHNKANPVNNTWYFAGWNSQGAENDQGLSTADNTKVKAFAYEGRSVKVEAETTGGTVSALQSRLKWAKW